MFDLDRFVDAQRVMYYTALEEIKSGRKDTHWIWFIFPQLLGLGKSSTSEMYGVHGIEEAKAYLKHPLLKENLLEITQVLYDLNAPHIQQVMPYPDHLKLQSCMTLFLEADPSIQLFQDVLNRYFGGQKDTETLNRL